MFSKGPDDGHDKKDILKSEISLIKVKNKYLSMMKCHKSRDEIHLNTLR